MSKITHVGEDGRVHMVDVGRKVETDRTAVASGRVTCSKETVEAVISGRTPKGAVLTTAELAGIMGAKRTADLIPLCHPLSLSKVTVSIEPDLERPGFSVRAEVRTRGQTGVEMEALTAVSTTCLTIYDMLKALEKSMRIEAIQLDLKTGGKSGDWSRK
ncbi:MAG: cyclic pyranopterin monophosphate synthase MoaC [Pseudomonadota bacterium]